MIDGIRRRSSSGQLHPADKENMSQIVMGDHSKDSFKTPESVAAHEEQHAETSTAGNLLPDDQPPSEPQVVKGSGQKRSLKEWFRNLSKKQKIIFWVVTALVVIGIATGVYFLFLHKAPASKQATKVNKVAKQVPPAPTTVASNLTGLQVDPSVNQRSVTGVMIENSQDARPQSSLEQAGVVFEAIAEGGITRFLALYQDTTPDYIGPVRSVRPYYLQWLQGFDAPVAHVGGSPEALQDIKSWGVKDLDQFYNGAYYHRITSRVAPHNVYTSMDELNQLETAKGFGTSHYTGFLRKADAPSKAPTARVIDLTISSATFNAHYEYDPATNSYKRFEGGAAHGQIDKSGGQTQISPKVVVALVMQQGIEADDLHTSYTTLGSGQVYVFEDGNVYTGTWHKASNQDQFTFTDAAGQPIKLDPGQTWLTALGSAGSVAYKP